MNVKELIEALQDHDPEAEVRIAHQPSWPLQCGIAPNLGVIHATDHEDDYEETVVYIGEGELGYKVNPYVPGVVCDQIWGPR